MAYYAIGDEILRALYLYIENVLYPVRRYRGYDG